MSGRSLTRPHFLPENATLGIFRAETRYTFLEVGFSAKLGEYDYFCAVHPHMTGKVIVK
jgi:plastocyanin